MSALGGQILCGSYLGEISTNLPQIWTCAITIVTINSAVPCSRGADNNGGVSNYISVDIDRAQ